MIARKELNMSKKEEIWMPIQGYSKYLVSNRGRIKTIQIRGKKVNQLMVQTLTKKGYLKVTLYENNNKKTLLVHQIVAQTFIPNPNNKPQVNHKNGIKTDNRVENLEWNTAKENVNHSIRIGLRKALRGKDNPCSKTIIQMDLGNNIIHAWGSSKEVERELGIDQSLIIRCCQGKQKTSHGSLWRYGGDVK